MYRWLLSLLFVAVVAVQLGLAWTRAALHAPLAVTEAGYVLDIRPGTPLRHVADRLSRDEVLDAPLLFTLYARLEGSQARIRAGEFLLTPGTTPLDLLDQLVEGRVRLHALTIVEGWTVRELLRATANHPVLESVLTADGPEALAAELGLEPDHAEGLFLPDTYLFPRGTKDRDVLLRAHRDLQDFLEEVWAQRPATDLPLTSAYEALILASIIERETGLESERRRIAGVFVRRLQQGMRLQTDPTVIYGLEVPFTGRLTRTQLDTDTPYNTYTRAGLPPTPIALPGRASIRAALEPEPGDYLYFVATGKPDGSHYFSATLAEHNAAVRRYRQRLAGQER